MCTVTNTHVSSVFSLNGIWAHAQTCRVEGVDGWKLWFIRAFRHRHWHEAKF